jgi:60 kDa SS-A/Ro ribonucleoprotein
MSVEKWALLDRFLILGSEENSYRVGELELNPESATAVRACLITDGPRVVRTILDGSGRDPDLFVLALAASPKYASPETNAAALDALPRVARTGAQLRRFAAFCTNLRGWGRSLRSAIAGWYLNKPADELARQLLESENHSEWSHRDLLRLSHPRPPTAAHNALFQWAIDGKAGHLATAALLDDQLRHIHAIELMKKADSEERVVHLIEDYRMTAGMVPLRWKTSPRVWETLMESMSYLELIRNLGLLTAIGLVRSHSETAALVVARLIDRKRIANSKVHPIVLLEAFRNYREGSAQPGTPPWTPVPAVIDALNAAFHIAFDNVRPTGKRIYLAADTSCSMGRLACVGMPSLWPAMIALALSLLYRKVEPQLVSGSFQGPPGIAPQAIEDALRRRLAVDAFIILTDRDTAGFALHAGMLRQYRQAIGIAAKLVVIAMAADRRQTTDPYDPLQLTVAGFDHTVPKIVEEFIGPS